LSSFFYESFQALPPFHFPEFIFVAANTLFFSLESLNPVLANSKKGIDFDIE